MNSNVIQAWARRDRIQAHLTREHEVHERFGRPQAYVFRGVEVVYNPDGESEKITTKQSFKTHEQALAAAFEWAKQNPSWLTIWDEIENKTYIVGDPNELRRLAMSPKRAPLHLQPALPMSRKSEMA